MTEQSSKPEFDSSAEKPLTKRGNVLLDPTDEHDAKLFINDLAHSFFDTKLKGAALPGFVTRKMKSNTGIVSVEAKAAHTPQQSSIRYTGILIEIGQKFPYIGDGDFDEMLETHTFYFGLDGHLRYEQDWIYVNHAAQLETMVVFEERPKDRQSEVIFSGDAEEPIPQDFLEQNVPPLDVDRLWGIFEFALIVIDEAESTEK